MQKYKGIPEFAMADRDSYNVEDDNDIPSLTMTSNMGVNELPPLPSEYNQNYQEVMFELERWAIFRALPPMIKYNKMLQETLSGMQSVVDKIPDYMNTTNPPSLFAYY